MPSLSDAYADRVAPGANRRRLAAAVGLSGAGAVLVAAVLVAAAVGDPAAVRGLEAAGVLAGLGVPAVLGGALAVLPAGERARAAGAIGAGLTVLGVGVFVRAYPHRWTGPGSLASETGAVYSLGAAVMAWCVLAAVAGRRSRRGGAVADGGRSRESRPANREEPADDERPSGPDRDLRAGAVGSAPRPATGTAADGASGVAMEAFSGGNGSVGTDGSARAGESAGAGTGESAGGGGREFAGGGTGEFAGAGVRQTTGIRAGGSAGTNGGAPAGGSAVDGTGPAEARDAPAAGTVGGGPDPPAVDAAVGSGRVPDGRDPGECVPNGRGRPTSDGGTAAERLVSPFDLPTDRAAGRRERADGAEVLNDGPSGPDSRDAYCGNCAHFRYVPDGAIRPYCGRNDAVMDDMTACDGWESNR